MKRINSWLDTINRYLVKHNIIKVFVEYEVLYDNKPIAETIIYDKLRNHYDDLYNEVNGWRYIRESFLEYEPWKVTFRSKFAFINTPWKLTFF